MVSKQKTTLRCPKNETDAVLQEVDQRESSPESQSLKKWQVSEFYDSLLAFLNELRTEASALQGGRLQHFVCNWESLTSDPEILELVTGVKLELNCDDAHLPRSFPSQPSLQAHEITVTDRDTPKKLHQTEKLHQKKTLSPSAFLFLASFLLPVFTRPKKDRSRRMILNFKCFNNDIAYHHFKMETPRSKQHSN